MPYPDQPNDNVNLNNLQGLSGVGSTQAGSSSDSPSSGGQNQGSSSYSNTESVVRDLLKNIDEAHYKLQKNYLEYAKERYFNGRKEFINSFYNTFNWFNPILHKYSAYLNNSEERRLAEVLRTTKTAHTVLNDRYANWNSENDVYGINRFNKYKEKFEIQNYYQIVGGNIIKQGVINAVKNQQISEEEAKEFFNPWVKVLSERPDLKKEYFAEIDNLNLKGLDIYKFI